MGVGDNKDDVTIEKILLERKGEITLIEGDPGSGKTTLTLQVCKQWAEGKLMITPDPFLILVPLRSIDLTTENGLFETFENLGCPLPGMKEHAQKNNGEDLVLILDGWDELPSKLQSASLFDNIVSGKNNMFFKSTIIVTSRPSCSENIAEILQQRGAHYQILGFSPINSELYIKHYFCGDLQSADLLINLLKGREYLHQHLYIPITIAIMCFVYSHSDDDQIPETLSKLYEHFVLLYICSNVPKTCRQDIKELNTLSDIPKTLKPVFSKLCKAAYDMLKENKLEFDEDVLGVTNTDLKTLNLDLEQFDGLGLLHVDSFLTKCGFTKKYYSFIHRAVQELLAAIFVLDTDNINDVLSEHFYEGSFLINIFPFLFGLVSKKDNNLTFLAGKLIQIFNKPDRSNELFDSILCCLYEAHDEALCCEFGKVFSKNNTEIALCIETILECHYASYFIAVCAADRLKVTLDSYPFTGSCDLYVEILYRYLQHTSTDISTFHLAFYKGKLSCKGVEQFGKTLSIQQNLVSVELSTECDPGCVTIICNNICNHHSRIQNVALPKGQLSEEDIESIGYLFSTCLCLEKLHIFGSPSEEMCLDLSHSFCKALCETTSLQELLLPQWRLSHANSKVFGNIISQNSSLKELYIKVDTADCLDFILKGLSSNTSITTFRGIPSKTSNSSTLGQCLEKCLVSSHSLKTIHFTEESYSKSTYISWLGTQVVSICTGLCANTKVVTLDISGCYIDPEACHAICGMLSQNTTLQHLFLNPVHLEKQEAVAIIDNCRHNALEQLSLVQWPPKIYSLYTNNQGMNPFHYSQDPEIYHVLKKINDLRQGKYEPRAPLKVYW